MKFTKITSLIVLLGLMFAMPAMAQVLPPLVHSCATGIETPSLQCFLVLLTNVAKWILSISGGLALLFFIYGGFMLLISRGNEQQIAKGKDILSKAIIGVIIIFGAYFIVDFLSRSVLQATLPKTPEGSLTEELNIEGLEQSTNTATTPGNKICSCGIAFDQTATIQTALSAKSVAKQACETGGGKFIDQTTYAAACTYPTTNLSTCQFAEKSYSITGITSVKCNLYDQK